MRELRLHTGGRSIDPVTVVAIAIACIFAVVAAAISTSIAPDAVLPGVSTPASISVIAGETRE